MDRDLGDGFTDLIFFHGLLYKVCALCELFELPSASPDRSRMGFDLGLMGLCGLINSRGPCPRAAHLGVQGNRKA
eukprot:3458457-Alexandrium_andersonii.AAC.1